MLVIESDAVPLTVPVREPETVGVIVRVHVATALTEFDKELVGEAEREAVSVRL